MPDRGRLPLTVAGLLGVFFSPLLHAQPTSFNLIEANVPEMQAAMDAGLINSAGLVQQYLDRIQAFDSSGPGLNSVLSLNPQAVEQARALDNERAAGNVRGPLHGIPILLKDNIDTFDLPTTAGALVLKDSIPPDDAFLTQQLRASGAVILGKAALSEWAYWLSDGMPSGFSAINGQTLNPYGPGLFDPVGSSTGSAVSVAANLAAIAVGTETLGSILSPSFANSAVGIRPHPWPRQPRRHRPHFAQSGHGGTNRSLRDGRRDSSGRSGRRRPE